ncbi:DUF2589 domain-containing protein [Natronoflexus pectinivorans]|uniref:Uncharacterized protein DUF2589 n=1 Tax=Natronoflexus pectinivorans TaxID=682526 RepID=A0A4R2GLI0_9BACT|nr:DUF2589 domain-containing protein [Natronoflexus pectinivorans]TCO09845.1 uncharacterized protein DUF2589 [Natronoflexus pectinivorans]
MANSITKKLEGLSMDDLISAPLVAACEAQSKLAQTAYKYMTEIGFEDGDFSKPNLLNFTLQRPVETNEGLKTSNVEVQAPFLGLVPIPSLLIDDVKVDFQMEVNSVTASSNKNEKEASAEAKGSFKLGLWGKGSVKVNGKVTTSKENTRSTNQTAKYQISVSAKQQPPTEGLSRLMDILASCTAPISEK